MKKLIVLSVVFALLASAAFAADVSGHVIGTANVLIGSTADGADDILAGAGMNRVRVEASGGDETFGAWIRLEGGMHGYAWWKPMDMLKLTIGSFGDGFFEKGGVARWMFYQTVTDTGVTDSGNQAWGGNYYGIASAYGIREDDDGNLAPDAINTSKAFFGGVGSLGVYLTISPVEMVDINLAIPFGNGGKVADVFKKTVAQVDLKLDFGNIALTYAGGLGYEKEVAAVPGGAPKKDEVIDPSKLYLYVNLGMIENLGIDIGFGYTLSYETEDKITVNSPIAAGLGLKYDADQFGVKFRTVATFAGSAEMEVAGKKIKAENGLGLLVDVLPYYVLSDTVTAFASIGIGMKGVDKADGEDVKDSDQFGWHFIPYVQVGSEWGPKFVAGIKVWSTGAKDAKDNTYIQWAVPIALNVSF
jgi:opacity protein-like surface antigen